MCKAVGIERLRPKYPLLLGKKRGYFWTSKLLPKTLILLLINFAIIIYRNNFRNVMAFEVPLNMTFLRVTCSS